MDRIIEAYLAPNRSLHEIADLAHSGAMNFLFDFSQACCQTRPRRPRLPQVLFEPGDKGLVGHQLWLILNCAAPVGNNSTIALDNVSGNRRKSLLVDRIGQTVE